MQKCISQKRPEVQLEKGWFERGRRGREGDGLGDEGRVVFPTKGLPCRPVSFSGRSWKGKEEEGGGQWADLLCM